MASSQQYPTKMENLPGDILSNIFIRLLAKKLAQMRCVSKSWNALLSRPSFIKSHLDRSVHKNREILLLFSEQFSSDCHRPFTAHPSRFPHVELFNFVKLPFYYGNQSGNVIGSINGLICIKYGSFFSSVIRVWNPSLSALLTLPPSPIPSVGIVPNGITFRFGFNPKIDDYKVLKLTSLCEPRMFLPLLAESTFAYHAKEWRQAEVFSMRNGSWKVITQRFPSHVTKILDQDEVCLDGHHWLGYTDLNWKQVIVAFDLDAESFREIPLPDAILAYSFYIGRNFKSLNVLGVLAGKICVMSRVSSDQCEVWVMEDYGVVESWVKRHVFSHASGIVTPVGFTLHNEFLFRSCMNRLALYDPVAAKTKDFKIKLKPHGIYKVV